MIRSHLGGKSRPDRIASWNNENTREAQQYATGALPFEQTPEGQKITEQERLRKEEQKANWQNFKGPNGDIVSVDTAHQTPPPGYVKAGAESTTEKPKKGLKLLGSEMMPYGVIDQDSGQQYLASQLGPNGDASAEAKQIWQTVQSEIRAKQDAIDKKDDERDRRFLQQQAAIAERMGRTEQFQMFMADFREQEGVYKALDQQAQKTQTLANTYEAQYKDPNTNKSAVDTALLTDYTSVLAQGGRKTQAEINMARNIGSFSLNLQQKLKKAATGELPDELRKMYLDYIKSAAKTQREDADKAKPSLTMPNMGGPEGPTTKKNRAAQKNSTRWTAPADAPPAPKEDGKFLKADGKIVAVSKGGEWTDPNAH
jgi:hypothetical protein